MRLSILPAFTDNVFLFLCDTLLKSLQIFNFLSFCICDLYILLTSVLSDIHLAVLASSLISNNFNRFHRISRAK